MPAVRLSLDVGGYVDCVTIGVIYPNATAHSI